ncbi:MAG: PAS domain S-box protein [Ignavibacteriaceae bacterium]
MEKGTAILIDQIPLGILTFSRNGRVEFINQNFHKLGLLYQFNTSLLNINILKYNIFPPANIIEELRNALNGKPFESEIDNIKTSDGKFISLKVKGLPVYEGNDIIGGILIIEDMQPLNETKEEEGVKFKITDEYLSKEEIFLIVTDTNGDIKYSAGKENPELNLLRKEITGKNIREIFNEETREKILQSFKTALQYGENQVLQLEFKIDNKIIKYNSTIEPVIGENGFVQIVYFIFKEIPGESKDALLKLEKLNLLQYYGEINRKKDTGFILINNNGKILSWDEQFERISSLETAEEKIINDIFPSLDLGEYLKIIRALNESNSCELNTYLKNKVAGNIPVNLNFFKAKESEATFIVVCSQIKTDIPVIKQETTQTIETEEMFKELEQAVCKIDKTGKILQTNPAFDLMLEFQDVLLQGENLFELLLAEMPANSLQELLALKPGERKSFDVKIRNRQNHKLDVNLIAEAVSSTGDVPDSFYCFLTKNFELKLRGYESIYQSLMSSTKEAMAVELDGKITKANDSFVKMFGYNTAEELINKKIIELVRDDDIPIANKFFDVERKPKEDRERIEFFAKRKDGTIFYSELYFIKIKNTQEQGSIFISRDTTERKRAFEAASDSEQKYKNIADNIDDILYTFERFNDKLYPSFYSSAVEKITGFTQIDFLNDPRLFLKIIHPDDFRDLKKRLSFLWKSDQQASSEFEFRIINKSGNIVWVRNKINVVRDSQGRIQKVYGLISDITYSKRAEEELKQSAANLKKLNDAKDRFLSIISHDLRAPFSSILGFTDLLLEDDTLTETEKHQYITYIQDSSKSMLALVNSMLEWTKLQTGRIKFEPEKISAKEIIDTSINTVSGTALKKGVEIENLVNSSYNIFADKYLILIVFNNLLSNAVKFTRPGDKITITVNTAPTARFIIFSVRDTGIGIKKENLDKLFSIETKYTSEGTSGEKGSGLGLSLVKEIIEKHGGYIEVKSEYEKGTEFLFALPVASTKILLVDPNKAERLFYSKVLINITTDYAVNVVSNGKEALERIISAPPALVITEHKMPLMSGYTLVQELIKNNLKKAIPVIVLANEIDRVAIEEYKELGVEYIFSKPVNLISLKDAIEKSLKKKDS